MHSVDDVLSLLATVFAAHEATAQRPATHEAIQEFEARSGITMPTDLRRWLRIFNGARIGPGGILGLCPEDQCCDIESMLVAYPEWKSKRWIPIAGDGCGNYYVLVIGAESNPVCFVDTASDFEELAYVVGSTLWTFLWFLLQYELNDQQWQRSPDFVRAKDPDYVFQYDRTQQPWPFSEDYVLANDPDIVKCDVAPLPWEA